jgi:hypothetical protein
VRYYVVALAGAVLLSALMTAQWAAAYLSGRPSTQGPSPVAIVLGWLVIAVAVAVPALIGWLKARRSAASGNGVFAAALFGALASFAAGPVPAVILPLLGPVTVTSVGVSAVFAAMLAPFTAGFCAGVAWATETFVARLSARRAS